MYNKLLKNGTAIAMIVGTIMIALFGIGIMTGETTVNDAGVEVVEVCLLYTSMCIRDRHSPKKYT